MTSSAKEVSEFRARILALVPLAPDDFARKDLHRLYNEVTNRYLVSVEEKKRLVMQSIEDGCAQASEIAVDTKLGRVNVDAAIVLLLDEKMIFRNNDTKTGKGRPSYLYFLTKAGEKWLVDHANSTTNNAR